MSTRWKTLLSASCVVLVSLAANTTTDVDATKLGCAQFRELRSDWQRRILAFLQGYAHREVPDDQVGSVPIGAGLDLVVDACMHDPYALVWAKVQELASDQALRARNYAGRTRPPTQITCSDFQSLIRDDQRMTVYWLDGYSRKVDPTDDNQSMVALDRKAEVIAQSACGRRKARLWWIIQGGVRSIDPTPPPDPNDPNAPQDPNRPS
ncbi:MAG TPA: hypothetical protein VMR31_15830 [Myxococcota bacterium]|nr:hypothetical protein [Myxococcota bacterium]